MQQAIEKMLKTYLELKNIRYANIHDITALYVKCREAGFPANDQLAMMGGTLTLWEATTRYDDGILATMEQFGFAKNIYHDVKRAVDQELSCIREAETEEEMEVEPVSWDAPDPLNVEDFFAAFSAKCAEEWKAETQSGEK